MVSGFWFFFGGYFGKLAAAMVLLLLVAASTVGYLGWLWFAEKLLGYRWVPRTGLRRSPQLVSPKDPRHPNNEKQS